MNSQTKEHGSSMPYSPSCSKAMALKRRYKKIAQMKDTKNTSRRDDRHVRSPSTSSPPGTPSNTTKSPGSSSLSLFRHNRRHSKLARGDDDSDDMTIQSSTSQRSMKERMKKLGRPFKPLRKLGSMVGGTNKNKSPHNGKEVKNYKTNRVLQKNKVRPTRSGHTPFNMKTMMAKNRNNNGQNETGSGKSPIREPPIEVVATSTNTKKKKMSTGDSPLAVSSQLRSPESLSTKLPSSIPESISFVTSTSKNCSNSKHDRFDNKITSDESMVVMNPYLWNFVALAVVWWKFGSMGVIAALGMYVLLTRKGNPGV